MSQRAAAKNIGFGLIAIAILLCAGPAHTVDTLWKTVTVSGHVYEVHLVTDGTLGSGFPARALSWSTDRNALQDIYVVDQSDGQAVEVTRALQIVSLVQSSYKPPANPANLLSAFESIPDGQIVWAGRPYELWTSNYFDEDYVDSFVVSGAEGLDDINDRTELYALIFFDMILQPDMMDAPGREHRYQMLLDLTNKVEEFAGALGGAAETLEKGQETSELSWQVYKNGVGVLKTKVSNFFDVNHVPPNTPATPLSRLASALDIVQGVVDISGGCARELLLQALSHERAQARIPIIEAFLNNADYAGELDPAMRNGFDEAVFKINQYIDGYYDDLDEIIVKAVLESGDNVLRLAKFSKFMITHFFGKAAAAQFGHVALPYILSYQTFQGIRTHADKARTASLAATLQRKLFDDSYGLAYHKTRFVSGAHLDGRELNAFLELYQMSWYLGARHYQDVLWALNNRLTWIWGAGIDLLSPGTPYADAMDDIRSHLERDRAVAQLMVPTGFLASSELVQDPSRQTPEFDWLASRIRGSIVSSPTVDPPMQLGVCVTLPWDPNGTPAVEGINIRFESRQCWDSSFTQDWECGPNDPDGECTAKIQLAWDTDTNPNNADCDSGASGPCPIVGAAALNPKRGVFVWEPLSDALPRDDYYIYATITDRDEQYSSYSTGHYEFVDPIFEADAWQVMGVETVEDSYVADGDGIPEIGETVEIGLVIRNESGRTLEGIKIHRLILTGDSVRHLVTDEWDRNHPDDLETSFILDDTILTPDASPNQSVMTTDEFDVYVGSLSPTTVPLIAWISYWDYSNPTTPQYRRIQEIAFDLQVSDGSDAPFFRCDHTDLVSDSDGDGIFESGEDGDFTVTLCNDGSWAGTNVRGTFDDPPPQGSWDDNDASFPDIDVDECRASTNDFDLDLDLDECGTYTLPLTVTFGDGQSQTGLSCQITAVCVPWQSIRDDADVGVVSQGTPVTTAIPISNRGAATLHISSVVEESSALDTSIDSFPATLSPGTSGEIVVTINTTAIAPGRTDRTIVVTSDANNTDERESIIYFGVSAGGAAVQLTFNGISSLPDLYGNTAVYQRGGNIYAIDVNTKVETQLTTDPNAEYNPRIWGRRVVFSRRDPASDTTNIFLYDLDSQVETQLTNLSVYQIWPDIHGDLVIWGDCRDGNVNADVYQYLIGSSSMNGSLLVDLGSRYAINKPRIEDSFIAYEIEHYTDPNDDTFYTGDMGYFRRSNSQKVSLGLEDSSPCSPGSGFDIFGDHFAFGCDCGSSCDRDDQVYYVNMSTNSAPDRLTCVPDLNDREDPVVMDDKIIYTLDGDDDIYELTIGSGCQTEVPLHVGAAVMRRAGGNPRTGAYVFQSNESGSTQLWGVIPPPAVDLAIESFDSDAEATQGEIVDYQIEIRNRGQDPVGSFTVAVAADGTEFVTHEVVGGLNADGLEVIDGSWNTSGESSGAHTLSAYLSPPPTGDADSSNDQAQDDVTLVDDDLSPPLVSNVEVNPGPTDDGDPFLEDGEQATARWMASDISGISSTSIVVGGTQTFPGISLGSGWYEAELGSQTTGEVGISITATDNDDSPETSDPVVATFSVFPAAPAVSDLIPDDEATDVDPRSAIRARFTVDLNPATVNSGVALLETSLGAPVLVEISYIADVNAVQIQPTTALSPNTLFYVTVNGGSEGIHDIRGNPLPSDAVWSFTTGVGAPPEEDIVFMDDFEAGDTGAWSSTFPTS